MQTQAKIGMKTMNMALYELVQKRAITYEEALTRTTDHEDFKRQFDKGPGRRR